ncbi:hypothetical protein EUX98_g2365 [Antrodiella citrinella]|uniref:Xylanolytic transcriptional activator regulatory domain-containing protein n=1 Tax=Antrodiella citrinella TaxID=2447956 RepID=A0A4S4N247_9APHY|nr:hypothetical protein EUX98_g2365 [Antrodiella citrinella]
MSLVPSFHPDSYSDVQSLHNRLLVVEGALSQLSTSSPSSSSLSSALGSVPPFKSSYPTSSSSQVPSSGNFSQGSAAIFSNCAVGSASLAGLPCNDRALLATGPSGSSVIISLEDVAGLWMNELDSSLNAESTGGNNGAFPPFTSLRPNANSSGKVKLEPSPVLLPLSPSSLNGHSSNASTPGGPSQSAVQPPVFIPPVPHTLFLPSVSQSDPSSELPQVTPALLQHLPVTAAARAHLIRGLSRTMALHPCFNIRHFERRVEAMMAWGEPSAAESSSDDGRPKARELARELFLGIPPARKRKPTLSFFAGAAAAFALGSLVANEIPEASGSPGAPGTSSPSPAAMYALSEQALGLFEKTSSYDVDSLIAMILQVMYQMHDGQMRIAQGVFPMVAKMVNVARLMGLGVDPDEFPGTYSLFDAETRRRVWWDIYYYDVFISDCMGHSPLIADGSFTTKLPADVDEHHFTSSSTSLAPPSVEGDRSDNCFTYFILKCRLAQLVKSIRKQISKDAASEDGADLSIDLVAASESDVTLWLSELPPRYQLDVDPDLAHALPPSCSSATLTAQRCVLAMTAARITLKLYIPFLRDTQSKPPHQASLGSVTAAHTVVSAARLLHSVWKGTRPAAFDFYDYGRSVFDAAVVCAHTVIQQPTSILTTQAMQIVSGAMDILHDLGGAREDGPNDAWKIVDMMRRKAELSKANGLCMDDANAGHKRKRTESDENSFDNGLQLPYVGASITSTKTDQARPILAPSRPSIVTAKEICSGPLKPSSDSAAKSLEEKKSKDKTYPPVGIRVRPGQNRPFNRQRTHSLSPNSPLVLSGSHPPSSPADVMPAQLETVNLPPHAGPESSSLGGYSTFHPSPPQMKENPPPSHPMPQEQYSQQMGDPQRYSHTSFQSSSPPMPGVYDPNANGTSFAGPGAEHMQPPPYNQSPPDFYQYSQAGGQAFNQGLPMPDYATGTPVESVPNAPGEHSYLLPSDKYRKEHMGAHDYHAQRQPGMGMVVQAVPGWPGHGVAPAQQHQQAQQQQMWEYKYYNGVAG